MCSTPQRNSLRLRQRSRVHPGPLRAKRSSAGLHAIVTSVMVDLYKIPQTVPLLPLRELIVFPHEVYPIFVGRQKSIKALEAAESKKTPILLVAQKDAKVAEPAAGDLYAVGTLGVVVQLLRLPDGTVKALLEGKKRARVIRYVTDEEYFQVEAEEIEETNDRSTEVEALMRS